MAIRPGFLKKMFQISRKIGSKTTTTQNIDRIDHNLQFSTSNSHSKMMDSLQYTATDKKLKLVQLDIPEKIEANKILIKVVYAGICGTDLHLIDGDFPCTQNAPITLGHEFCGTVEKIGKNVQNIKAGDRVVIDPETSCMLCDDCRNKNVHYCKKGGLNTTLGFFRDGGWSQYCVVPDVQVYKIPNSLKMEQAALCEPVSCLSHTWDRLSPMPVGKKVLVLGSGIIGNLMCSILHLQGHRKVTVSEPSKQRLDLTKRLDTGFDLITPDVLKTRNEKDENYLFDVIIDCSGNAKAIEHAYTLLNFGGKLCCFGVANPNSKICISPFDLFKKELQIFGALINPYSFNKALSLLESMGDRYIAFDKLGIEVFPLSNYEDAIQKLRKGSIAKAMFKL